MQASLQAPLQRWNSTVLGFISQGLRVMVECAVTLGLYIGSIGEALAVGRGETKDAAYWGGRRTRVHKNCPLSLKDLE